MTIRKLHKTPAFLACCSAVLLIVTARALYAASTGIDGTVMSRVWETVLQDGAWAAVAFFMIVSFFLGGRWLLGIIMAQNAKDKQDITSSYLKAMDKLTEESRQREESMRAANLELQRMAAEQVQRMADIVNERLPKQTEVLDRLIGTMDKLCLVVQKCGGGKGKK